MPLGNGEVVVMLSGGGAALIVRLSGFVVVTAVGVAESVTVTVTMPLKGTVGIPLIKLLLTLRPEGKPDAVNV